MEVRRPSLKALGYPAGTKLLVINCDEFGECHASNMGIIEAMEKGLGVRKYAVGASVQMPSPWAAEAVNYARAHPEADVGVHLTINSSFSVMMWRPLCSKKDVPGLYNPEGYFWRNGNEAWMHSNEKEIYKECRAQIEMALGLGLDVTHIDGHDGFQGANYAGYCNVCGTLAEEFRLPLRMQPRWKYEKKGAERFRDEVLKRGIIVCDDDTGGSRLKKPEGETFKEFYARRLCELSPGLTDLYIHPSIDSEELRSLGSRTAQSRSEQYQTIVHDPDIQRLVRQPEIRIVNWRDIRDLQRKKGVK